MEPVIYFNRAFRPESEATVSVRSRALHYGLGCFAGIRGYKTDDGRQIHVFRLDRHVRRLDQSARILQLALSGSPSEITAVVVELLRRNEVRDDVYIRPIVFANSNELSPLLDVNSSETAIFCLPLGRYLSAAPIDVCVSSWRRVRETAIPARAKATAGYLNSALARREAMDNGYTEAILLTEEGHVSEGSAEHVFMVRDGQLISPPSTADNLDGITRQSLIVLARGPWHRIRGTPDRAYRAVRGRRALSVRNRCGGHSRALGRPPNSRRRRHRTDHEASVQSLRGCGSRPCARPLRLAHSGLVNTIVGAMSCG